MTSNSPQPAIGIIILAAGASRRMGRPKQLLEYQGQTLLNRTIGIARSLNNNPVIVVLGANAELIEPTISNSEVGIVYNPDWDTGMGSSIRTGLNALLEKHSEISAVLVLLVDQPYLTADLLNSLITEYQQNTPPVVAARYGEVLGVPALFNRSVFPRLFGLDKQVGARKVIASYRQELRSIPFPKGAIDLDTPSDWEQFNASPSEHGE